MPAPAAGTGGPRTGGGPALDPNGPLNTQHQVVADLTHAVNDRWNVTVGGPWYRNGFSVRRAGPASATPYFQDTPVRGFGDIGARARYRLLSTQRPGRNIGLSGGVKFPIRDSPTSTRREDATVPKYMFIAGYARRF